MQVRDLRRLLELYQRWHPRVFNACDYNQFEATLEKMSGTHPLKVRDPGRVPPRNPAKDVPHTSGRRAAHTPAAGRHAYKHPAL